ncbi:MAG: PAS domain S-box protein [Verrucomicrobiae bacterium]|nr:PAS domain S-box protein [Verrucomicrobiae bacterium]
MLASRITLSRRISILLTSLGVILIATALVAFAQLRRLEGTYARLLDQDGRALGVIPQITVVLHDAARLVSARLAATPPPEAPRWTAEWDALRQILRHKTGELRSIVPDFSQPISDFERAFDSLHQVGQTLDDAARSGRQDWALHLAHREFTPRFDRLRTYLPALGDQIRIHTLDQAHATELRSQRLIRRTLAFSVLVLVAALAAAQVWVWTSVARPLHALVHAVRRLVAGDTNLRIPGGERSDEIGLLASALGVFRSNLVRQRQLEDEERDNVERLRRSEAGFRSLIEAAPDALVITDGNRTIVSLNRQAERLLGWSRDELVGRSADLLVPERLAEEHASSVAHLLDLHDRLPGAAIELTGRRKDGSEFPIELTISPFESADGIRLCCSAIRDVSERRRTESELANQVAFQRALIDRIPYPIFIKDASARFLGCNRAYEQAFGIASRSLRGKTVLDLPYIPPDARRHFHEEDLTAIREQRRFSYELPITYADGITHVTLYSVDGFCLADGCVGGLIGLLVDISDRKAAEEELRRSQQLLQSVIDNAAAYIFVKDLEGRYLLVNQPYVDLLGRPAAEILGRSASDVFPPETADTFAKVERDVILHRQSHAREATIPIHGQPRHFLAHRFPLLDASGRLFGLGGVSTDITDIKRAQEEIARARDAAEAANRAKSAFVATMSHEIRTPMNAVINLTALALETPLSQRQRQYLSVAHSSARGLLALLNDILDFSKIEAGRLELEHAPFTLRLLLEEVADSFRGRVLETRIEFGVLVADDVPDALVGDTLRLRQVLTNLLGNAFKFTEHGEIAVRVASAPDNPSHPDSHAPRPAPSDTVRLRFTVADSGIGIAPDKLERLFEAFSQADSSTSRRYGGSGLGLAICRRLVELMHGRIEVRSQPGQGSEFSFTAQFSLASETAPSHPSPPLPNSLLNTPALVIENASLSRELLVTMLRRFGLQADGVATADEGLRLLNPPDIPATAPPYRLVILDWFLPDLPGLEVARRLRQLPVGPDLAIILVGSHATDDDERAARDAGVSAFLPKPITGSLLLDAITRATGLRPEISAYPPPDAPPPSFLQQRRILVAEDNEANQFVVREILEQAGASVDLAANGHAALERVLAHPYDLVLMDMQMPGMDGLEATRRIREQFPPSTLPVVALTANALRSDVDACLDAGMNDYVAKPIERSTLFATLARWLPTPAPPESTSESPSESQSESESESESPSPSQSTPDPDPDPSAIPQPPPKPRTPRRPRAPTHPELELGLPNPPSPQPPPPSERLPGVDLADAAQRLGLPQDAIESLLLRFADGQRTVVDDLRRAIAARQPDEARRLAHSLAGAAGNLSILELRRLAKTIELALRFEQGNLPAMLDELDREAARVFAGLDALAHERTHPPEAHPPLPAIPSTSTDSILLTLADHLDSGDLAAIDDTAKTLRQAPFPAEHHPDLDRLHELIASFLHDDAARLARDLAARLGPPS